eukprot:CAMPEP_0114422490 /NCGR_PEP_ID=MMETSP0103-20121206/5638_1 /TAXON_ID=37642 ORGANISM="Paraphysomonas imperforata, Strain PA2" /NCGR_SAMPLE_ID=MMETSP0103 /ASSEMBLY_ACC=CAM_ASM_000201 /LENGTH=189 /DNA_ID=CAMNT_0001591079 /DNA_START=331 /DNA_END=900 /DNA_ORIENTATION=-
MSWGVSLTDSDYGIGETWKHFHAKNDTNNSVINIFNAVIEFQQRSEFDDNVVILFNSNLWDSGKYRGFEDLMRSIPQDEWVEGYRRNYTHTVRGIKQLLRPSQDNLILQTAHSIRPPLWREQVVVFNKVIEEVGRAEKLPVFRGESSNLPKNDHLIPRDNVHQKPQTALRMANMIKLCIELNWVCDSIW